ncbi:MAG: hypothetical protein OP8BY_0144 [Candidatus Saccharicenans subterraneus]|uniref:Uncharacterized protein n=1 Tax=Candidatus Saccharicenans subterraneus TaxID=2508984 RepID=A0A3E2BIT8_9BACT|nr:MAG: hypothetical protein OP8BY_0144 [Candidatus Saccharicenans subterraneum]
MYKTQLYLNLFQEKRDSEKIFFMIIKIITVKVWVYIMHRL